MVSYAFHGWQTNPWFLMIFMGGILQGARNQRNLLPQSGVDICVLLSPRVGSEQQAANSRKPVSLALWLHSGFTILGSSQLSTVFGGARTHMFPMVWGSLAPLSPEAALLEDLQQRPGAPGDEEKPNRNCLLLQVHVLLFNRTLKGHECPKQVRM